MKRLVKTDYTWLWYYITDTKKETWNSEEILRLVLEAKRKKLEHCGGKIERYWINFYRLDEHLRSLADNVLKWKPPYKEALSEILDPFTMNDSSQQWYFRTFHRYGVYYRCEVLERWARGETPGRSWGNLDVSWSDYNRLVPVELTIPLHEIVPIWELHLLEDRIPLWRFNELMRDATIPYGNHMQYENMTLFEYYWKYNINTGVKWYRWVMWYDKKCSRVPLTIKWRINHHSVRFSFWCEKHTEQFFRYWKVVDNGDLINFFMSLSPGVSVYYIIIGFLYVFSAIAYMYFIELFSWMFFQPLVFFVFDIIKSVYNFLLSNNKVDQLELKYYNTLKYIKKKIKSLDWR